MCSYLAEHPDVYFSPLKEPKFFLLKDGGLNFKMTENKRSGFLHRSRWTLEGYEALFEGANEETVVAEGSAGYICAPNVAQEIYQYNPGAKIIAVLRNPIERAYSHFLFQLQVGYETEKDFGKALALESQRIQEGYWHSYYYKTVGLYYQQLKAYFDIFPREQIWVCLQEDLKVNTVDVMRNVYTFLGIDPGFKPDVGKRHNVTVKNAANQVNPLDRIKSLLGVFGPLKSAMKSIPAIKGLYDNFYQFPPLKQSIVHELRDYYAEDVYDLSRLLNRDLSYWLEEDVQSR